MCAWSRPQIGVTSSYFRRNSILLPTYLHVFDQSMLVISTYFSHFDADKWADR